jgi:hypothetical protein
MGAAKQKTLRTQCDVGRAIRGISWSNRAKTIAESVWKIKPSVTLSVLETMLQSALAAAQKSQELAIAAIGSSIFEI